jgi:hypothetical protein
MPSMRKSKSRRNFKPKNHKGGFFASSMSSKTITTKPYTPPGIMRPTMAAMRPTTMQTTMQYGGSPASSLLMNDATANPPVMNDYITSPRIRDSWYDGSLSALEPKYGQKGGSLASNLVTEQLNEKPKTESFSPAWSPKGDMNSLNLYQTTGGSRRKNKSNQSSRKQKKTSNKSKKNLTKKSKRNTRNNRNHNHSRSQRGGGSDWIMSQYSLGPSNYAEQSAGMVGQFSQSAATPRADYMNPSTLGLAGSGYPMSSLEGANVSRIGAPIM